MASEWIFSEDEPTVQDLMNIAIFREESERAFLSSRGVTAMVALLVSRDRSEPRHSIMDVFELTSSEMSIQIDAMMAGLRRGRDTTDLMEKFRKEGT